MTAAAVAACLDVLTIGLGVPEVLTPGDTVTGVLQDRDDVDKHYYRLGKGERWVAFLGTVNPDSEDSVGLAVTTGLGVHAIGRVRVAGTDTSMLDHATGEFEIQLEDVHTVHVASYGYTGGYRFLLRPVVGGSGAETGEPTAAHPGQMTEGTLYPPTDVDAFPFLSDAGEIWNVYFQALSGSSSDTLLLRVRDARDVEYAAVTSAGVDTALTGQVTGSFQLAAAGTYQVEVRGKRGAVDAGAYRFVLWRIDPAPEGRPAAVSENELVEETIEPLGDLDRFLFDPVASDQWVNVFFQDMTGSERNRKSLTVRWGTDDRVLASVSSGGQDSVLSEQCTGRFLTQPSTGYVFHVEGANSTEVSGPYRFRVLPIDAAPEHVSADYVIGDTVTEALDVFGDVDEFGFSVPAEGIAAMEVWSLNAAGQAGIRVVVDAAGPDAVLEGSWVAPGGGISSGRFAIAAGPHRIRAYSASDGSSSCPETYLGEYSFALHIIDPDPEIVPPIVNVGDTVSGETIWPVGDFDVFTVPVAAGQLLYTRFENQSDPASSFTLEVYETRGFPAGLLIAPGDTSSLSTTVSPVSEAVEDGDYRLVVKGWDNSLVQQGPYRLAVEGVSRGPEEASPLIAVGDTVSDETIYIAGDVDEFRFSGTSGQMINVFFRGTNDAGQQVNLEVIDEATDSVLGLVASLGQDPYIDPRVDPATGRITLSASREYLVRVRGVYGSYVGGYVFDVWPIDLLPEVVSPSVSIGDTVTAEGFGRMGDIDEFEFDGTAGDEIRLSVEVFGTYAAITLTDLSAGINLIETGGRSNLGTSLTLDSTGRYRLRLTDTEHVVYATPVPYAFSITR